MDEVKYMPIREFRLDGYLHEVNRLLLHPLGLALEVSRVTEPGRRITIRESDVEEISEALAAACTDPVIERLLNTVEASERLEEGDEFLNKVWDERDDPEGIDYAPDLLSAEKAEQVAEQMFARRKARADAYGYVVQPVESDKPTLTTTYIDPTERTQR